MAGWQEIVVLIYGLIALVVFGVGYWKTRMKGEAFKETPGLFPLGIFVWGDAIVIGLFWLLVSVATLLLQRWEIFLTLMAGFWLIRSLGETMYWINQQFSSINRNPPERLKGYWLFKNDSVWFAYQTFWQCLAVISLVLTIYLVGRW